MVNGYRPNGIIARDVINNDYKYNKEYKFYTMENSLQKNNTLVGSDTKRTEKRDSYEIEL